MSNLSVQDQENKAFQKLIPWILLILFIGFTAAGLVRMFITSDSIGVNATKLQLQVKSGLQNLIFGFLFLIGWILTIRYDKKRITVGKGATRDDSEK